jgi:hypothetical protein
MMDEKKMVEELIEIFYSKVDKYTIPKDEGKNESRLVASTFDEAIKLIESKIDSN